MSFTTFSFGAFFAAVFCVYWALPQRLRKWAALAASAAFYAPFGATPTLNGVVAYASSAHTCAVTARTNLQKLAGDLTDPAQTSRNEAFTKGDYLHSYRYCGNLPSSLP